MLPNKFLHEWVPPCIYYSTTSYFEKRQDFFICSTHRVNKDKCS